jgi:hypothetical protein
VPFSKDPDFWVTPQDEDEEHPGYTPTGKGKYSQQANDQLQKMVGPQAWQNAFQSEGSVMDTPVFQAMRQALTGGPIAAGYLTAQTNPVARQLVEDSFPGILNFLKKSIKPFTLSQSDAPASQKAFSTFNPKTGEWNVGADLLPATIPHEAFHAKDYARNVPVGTVPLPFTERITTPGSGDPYRPWYRNYRAHGDDPSTAALEAWTQARADRYLRMFGLGGK